MRLATLFFLVASSLAIEFLCGAPRGLIGAAGGDGSLALYGGAPCCCDESCTKMGRGNNDFNRI